MPFRKQSSPEDEQRKDQAQQEEEASLRSLQDGGLPLQAQRRLREERTEEQKLFTSDLSVNGFVLTRQRGYQPLSQVMGSSIYHVGWQYMQQSTKTTTDDELPIISKAHQEATRLALNRLEQEATLLKAHGVIGLQLTTRNYEWGKDLLEYTAIGTAITLPGTSPPERPFLSDLSGQEFWALLQAGYSPVGLATGYCAYYVSLGTFNAPWYNRAITPFSRAISTARNLAMRRAVDMALKYNARGIVGMHIDCRRQAFAHGDNLGLYVQFSVIGTAISVPKTNQVNPTPLPTLTFTDLRPGQKGQKHVFTSKEQGS